LRVEVRDSDTHAVIMSLTESTDPEDYTLLRMLVPRVGTTELISFVEDRTAWLEGLPVALTASSRIYAEAVPDHPHLAGAVFDKAAYMKQYHIDTYEKKKQEKEAKKEQGSYKFIGPKKQEAPKPPATPKPVAAPAAPAPIPAAAPPASALPPPNYAPAFSSTPTVHPAAPASGAHFGLNANEVEHLSDYQGSSSGLNGALRADNLGYAGGSRQQQIAALDRSMEKAPRLEADTTLYRGVPDAVAAQIEASGVGSVFQDKAYVSTSFHQSTAKGFGYGNIIHISAPAGTKGIDMNKVLGSRSTHKNEKEFLLPRGSSFRLTKVEKVPHESYGHGGTKIEQGFKTHIHAEIVHG
jgi:hypothetical protein